MKNTIQSLLILLLLGFALTATAQGGENLYLVSGSKGPGFTSPQQAAEILEKGILPTFDVLMKLQRDGKILVGGLPVGDRAFLFVLQASSNHEVDQILRSLPAWGAMQWKVKALESFSGRADQERALLKRLKQMMK